MDKLEFTIDKKIFTREAVIRTCYLFTGKYYIDLTNPEEHVWLISMQPRVTGVTINGGELAGEFKNLLLNETFRENLMDKSRTIKEILIARALFGAAETPGDVVPLTEDESDFSFIEEEMDDYLEDPLGIAVPWEVKQNHDTVTGKE